MPHLNTPRSAARKAAPRPKSPQPAGPELEAAFQALQTYDRGSSRGALRPLDAAVMAALDDVCARGVLEERLIAALGQNLSFIAREYVCSKLTLIGTEQSVPALAAMLPVPELATAARNALEAIPGRRATRALRESLPKLTGGQKIGTVHSLGMRRDADSVRVLAALLLSGESDIATAAIAALGEKGTVQAARALRGFQSKAPERLQPHLADACLACAEALLNGNRPSEAEALLDGLANQNQPVHIQRAVALGLQRIAVKRQAGRNRATG